MSNRTPNLNLEKPLQEEFYDVDVQNGNMDKIDAAIEAVKEGYVKKSGDTMTGNLEFSEDVERAIRGLNSRMGIGISKTYLQAYDWAQSQEIWRYTKTDKRLELGTPGVDVVNALSVGGDVSFKGNLNFGRGKHITLWGLADGTLDPYLDFAVGDGGTSGSISFAADQNFHLRHAGVSGTSVGLVTGDLMANGHLWMEDTTAERNIRSRSGNMGFVFPAGGSYLGAFDWGNNVNIWAYTKATKMLTIGAPLAVSGAATFNANLVMGDGGDNKLRGYNSNYGLIFRAGSFGAYDWKSNNKIWNYDGSTVEIGADRWGVQTKIVYSNQASATIKALTANAPRIYFENMTDVMGFIQVQADRFVLCMKDESVADLYARHVVLNGNMSCDYATVNKGLVVNSDMSVSGKIIGKLAGCAATLGRGGDNTAPMTFNWQGKDGQPTWLWGGSDWGDMYVYNPSNFDVAKVGGYTAAQLLAASQKTSASLGNNGWWKDSNTGLMIQWGNAGVLSNSGTTVVFPTAFPAACARVFLIATGTISLNEYGAYIYSKAAASFVGCVRTLDGKATTANFEYIAIGY